MWPTNPKIFSVWPFTESVCFSLVYIFKTSVYYYQKGWQSLKCEFWENEHSRVLLISVSFSLEKCMEYSKSSEQIYFIEEYTEHGS